MPTNQPCLLYVDDDRSNRVVFELTFKEKFPLITVGSGLEALDVMKRQPVAVLLTDQRMPQMSGHELLERVREEHPETTRIVMTAFGQLEPILQAVNEGLVARYILKPWKRDELETVIDWAFSAYEFAGRDAVLRERLLQTERLVTIGSMTAAVFHDLSQPLALLVTNCERMMQLSAGIPALKSLLDSSTDQLSDADSRLLNDLCDDYEPIADDLQQGCEVMADLVNNMRRLVRPQNSGQVEICQSPTRYVDYAISVCNAGAVLNRGAIRYRGEPVLPALRVSPTEFVQVLFNLIQNAWQALDDGQTSSREVIINTKQRADFVDFQIIDNGAGIPDEVLEKLGTPFVSTKESGTGLGVAQCFRIVSKSGGSMNYESNLGEGTTVTVSFPIA